MVITRNEMLTSQDISENQGLSNEYNTANPHNFSTQSKSDGSNGALNFGIALGGILLVTVVVGVIAYLYRRRISCKQNISPMNSKISSGRVSCIMDCYSNDYVINTNNGEKDDKFGANDDVKDTVETNKSRSNTMKSGKSIASTLVAKITLKSSTSRSNTMKSSRSDTLKSNKSRNNTIKVVDEKDSHPQVPISTSLISLPISMSSASIYDKDRATTLANGFSRSDAFQIQKTIPPTPPLPTHLLTNDKQPKDIVRSPTKSDSDVDDVNSSGNLIPVIYVDSSTTTVVETIQPHNIDTKWFTNPVGYPIMPQFSSPITSSATATSVGVIPDWSKAPWQDDLTFHKSNNDSSNKDDDDDDDDNKNDNDDDGESHYSRDDYDNYSRKSSIDLIRFSKSSVGTANRDTRSRLHQFSLFKDKLSPNTESVTQDQNNPTSESPKEDTSFISKRLKEDIEKDLEKYDFLKYDAATANKYKRKGNVFEYRLQRSKTVI